MRLADERRAEIIPRYIQAKMKLDSIQSELDAIDHTRAALAEGKQKLQIHTGIQRARADAHPVRQAPSEVLMHIFELCVRSYEQDTERLGQAFKLSQICRKWRNAAIATPSLWGHIHIRFPAKGKQDAELEHFWELILPRLRNTKTNITITSKGLVGRSSFSAFDRLFPLSQIQRINKLRMDLVGPSIINGFLPVLTSLQHPFVELELHLSAESSNQRLTHNIGETLESMPPFQILKLFSSVRRLGLSLHKDLDSVREVELNMQEPFALVNLRHFPNMERLEMCEMEQDATVEEEWVVDNFVFPKLESIYVWSPILLENSFLNHKFLCPNLRNLRINSGSDRVPQFISELPNLKSLSILMLDEDELEEMIDAAPGLEVLGYPHTDSKLNLLYDWESTGRTSVPLPHLRELELSGEESLTLELFNAIVRHRCPPGDIYQKTLKLEGVRPIDTLKIENSAVFGEEQLWLSSPYARRAKIRKGSRNLTVVTWPQISM